MTVKLPEELKIFNVKEIWEKAEEEIKKAGKAGKKSNIIDAEKLEQFDGAGLQMLYMLLRELSNRNLKFEFKGLKEEHREKLTAYGFHISEINPAG